MKLVLLAALPLLALAINPLQYWVAGTAWPVYMGALPIRDPTNVTWHAPTSYDRAAHFWMDFVRNWNKIYIVYHLTDLYYATFNLVNSGQVSIDPRVHGFNTLNAARWHAYERFTVCPSYVTLTNTVELTKNNNVLNCDQTTTETTRQNWFFNTTTMKPFQELSVNRMGGNFGVHSLAAPRLAVADLACMGYWNTTHKKYVCPNTDSARAATAETLLKSNGNGVQEMSIAVFSDLSTSLQNYSVSMIIADVPDAEAPTAYNQHGSSYSWLSSVSHTVDSAGKLAFVADGFFFGGTDDTVTLYWENGTTQQLLPIENSQGKATNMYMWSSGIDVATASSTMGCIAYRMLLGGATSGLAAPVWYPGGTSSKQGWLKTQGLGACKQNYCPCLNSETTSTDPTATASCCEEDCYISTNTSIACRKKDCVTTAYCTGTSYVCPAQTFSSATTVCGYQGTGAECDISDVCNGAGVCTNNSALRQDGVACGSSVFNTCDLADKCLSNKCNPNYAATTVSCGTAASTDGCHKQDMCDGLGGCPVNNLANGVACPLAAPYNGTPTAADCWNTWTCQAASTTVAAACQSNWKSSTTVCNTTAIVGSCSLASTCSGTSNVCVAHFMEEDDTPSVVCQASGTSCIADAYCQKNNATCPALLPCQDCSLNLNSFSCNAVAEITATGFKGCKWCGEWGCKNRTTAKSAGYEECAVTTCSGAVSHDLYNLSPYATAPVSYVLPWNQTVSSLEVVTRFTQTRRVIDHVCVLLDVLGDANWAVVQSSTFTIRVNLYNVSATGSPDALINRSAWFQFTAADRGLKQINISVASLVWGVVADAYVGIESSASAPGFSVVGFVDSAPFEQSYYDNPNVTTYNWVATNGGTTSNTVQVYYTNGTCGDNFVSVNEQCDKGTNPLWSYFCNGCLCATGSVADSVTGGCKCATTLDKVYAHNFTRPPFMFNLTYASTAAQEVSFWIDLPQTTSAYPGLARDYRWDASAWLVNARTGDDLVDTTAGFPANSTEPFSGRSVNWDEIPMVAYACMWRGTKSFSVADLVKYGSPLIYVHDTYQDYYAIQFAVDVTWWEEVYLERRQNPPMPATMTQQRVMDARLTFEILVARDIDVSSNITVLDSKVMWAYIKRGFLVIPEIGDPYFQVMLETKPVSDGIVIDNSTFKWVNENVASNKIKNVTQLVQIGATTDRFQSWNFSVYFKMWTMCNLTTADSFILTYLLVAQNSSVGISPSQQNMTFFLTTTENWCSDHINVSLVPRQQTFAYPAWLNDTTAVASYKFLRGSTIYIRIDLQKDYGMPVSDITLEDVAVWGSAMSNASYALKSYQMLIANITSSPVYIDADWAVTRIGCDVLVGGVWKQQLCYSLFITPVDTVESTPGNDKTLFIESTIEVSFTTNIVPNKRALSPSEVHSTGSRIFLASPESVVPAAAQQQDQAVVVYRVTPGFLAAIGSLACISVLSVASTVYFIRRRESAQQL